MKLYCFAFHLVLLVEVFVVLVEVFVVLVEDGYIQRFMGF